MLLIVCVRSIWIWWSIHWIKFHAVATPIGSLLVTFGLSQTESVGWWGSAAELNIAADFASLGVLFYTATFALLEVVVIIMVLAWKMKEYFDKKHIDKGRELERADWVAWRDKIDAWENRRTDATKAGKPFNEPRPEPPK